MKQSCIIKKTWTHNTTVSICINLSRLVQSPIWQLLLHENNAKPGVNVAKFSPFISTVFIIKKQNSLLNISRIYLTGVTMTHSALMALECGCGSNDLEYIPRNMHTVFALLCFVVVIHWLIFPYPSGLLHWHCGNLTIAPVPAKQPWWIWINTSCEFIMNDCITTTKQSTTKPCAYFLGYTVDNTFTKQIGSR